MTVRELYEWAVKNGCENADIKPEVFFSLPPVVDYDSPYIYINEPKYVDSDVYKDGYYVGYGEGYLDGQAYAMGTKKISVRNLLESLKGHYTLYLVENGKSKFWTIYNSNSQLPFTDTTKKYKHYLEKVVHFSIVSIEKLLLIL